jgi:tetratricopeptide (TPR) repeat protein
VPFEVLDRQADLGYLGVGIPDAINARLAGTGPLRVRPTESVMHADLAAHALVELTGILETDYLPIITVQGLCDNIQVRLQLVHGADMSSLWARHYDLSRERRRYTSDPQAYDAYLKSRSELLHYTRDGTLADVGSINATLLADPRYALAHAGLAAASAQMHLRFAADHEVVVWGARAQREAALALQLNSKLAEVHAALAAVYGQTGFDWPRTISESHKALALNPILPGPHCYPARAYYHLGLLELIEGEVAAGLDIAPATRLEPLRLRGTAALVGGKFAEAKKWLAQARQFGSPAVTDWYYAQVLVAQTLAVMYIDHLVAYALGAAYAQLHEPERAVS